MGKIRKTQPMSEETSDPSVIQIPQVEDFHLSEDVDMVENVDVKTVDKTPEPTDPNWTAFILAQLEEDEKQDGNPKVDGLRRLVEKYIGQIVATEIECKSVPSFGERLDDNTSTVVAKVVVFNHLTKRPIVSMAVADAPAASCQHPYNKFLSSIAETRAKARCYRELLRLKNVVSADEVQGVGMDISQLITDQQKTFIDSLCKQLDISVKVAAYRGAKKELAGLSKYKKDDGVQIIELLTDFKNSGKQRDKSTESYDHSWREYFG